MTLRILILLLAINLVLVGFILAGRKPAKEKAAWSTVLLAIPLIGIAIYYFLTNKKPPQNPFKEWEKK
jgi:uncharacterized membrane protein